MLSLLNISARGLMQWIASSTGRRPTYGELSELMAEILWFQTYLEDRRSTEEVIAEIIAQDEYRRFLLKMDNHRKNAKGIRENRRSSKEKAKKMESFLDSPEFIFLLLVMWAGCRRLISWRSASPAPDPMPAFTVKGAAAVPFQRLATPEKAINRLHRDQQRRADAFEKHWSGADYPAALDRLIKSGGASTSHIGGRSPWSIVEERDPDVAGYLRSLDADGWREIKREVGKARGRVNSQIIAAEPGPDRRALERKLGWLRSGRGAAAYCAERVWRQRGQEIAAEPDAPAPSIEPTPEPENENEGRIAP